MRRMEYAMTPQQAKCFLAQQATFTLAATTPAGLVLRTLHGIVIDDNMYFHSSPKGEKTSLLDCEVIAAAEAPLTTLPSWFFDDQLACPATTLYQAVQVHGVLREVTDTVQKAAALQGLMQKLQPSGGYQPITHDHPEYRAAVNGLLVGVLPLAKLTGKTKLAQNKKPHEVTALLNKLWQRGNPEDPRALELVASANPQAMRPAWLVGPANTTLHVWLPPEQAAAAAQLLTGSYWNTAFSAQQIADAHVGSAAWVGATTPDGQLIASARALSDGHKLAWIYDVIVDDAWRHRGIATRLVELLLEHPQLRRVSRVLLGTRDAQALYAKLGFVERLAAQSYPTTDMVLLR
jgi:uncharacterized protein